MIHKAKKSMGQNFLKSEQALRMMCEAGMVNEKDTIIEIGPGKGALTVKLLQNAKKVIAIEKDRDLIDILTEKFTDEIQDKRLELLNADVLGYDPKDDQLKEYGYKIIANIPYNITGAIIKRFLSEVRQPNTMVLLVQKEVATRIVARDTKESILSLSVKVYGTPHYILKVSKRFFSPSPKVDSAIVAITGISRDTFDDIVTEERFFSVVRAGFAHKRKIVRKNLESVATQQEIERVFEELGIESKTRAEDLPLSVWIAITRTLFTNL